MAVRRPRRLFRWTTITPCVLVLLSLLSLLSLCAFATILLLLPVVLLWLSPAAVPLCFEMREPMTVDVCFGKKRLSKGSIAYTWKGVGSVFHGDDGDGSRKKWLRVSALDGAILRERSSWRKCRPIKKLWWARRKDAVVTNPSDLFGRDQKIIEIC